MKEQFVPRKFKPAALAQIDTANTIIDAFLADGLRLTLRQLFYQFVSHHALPNTVQTYKALGGLISDARLAGLIDWDAIEDRGRRPTVPSEFRDVPELMDAALASYRLDRWAGQPAYVELWVEKDALAGVLGPVARHYHAPLVVNKGYSSSSAMYAAAQRYLAAGSRSRTARDWAEDGTPPRRPVLLYLGDHDPSGEDMVRDVRGRMELFGIVGIDVRKVALTMAQVRQYQPAWNPAKVTDSRFAAYREKYGERSWEVDALDPPVLRALIQAAFDGLIDKPTMDAIKAREVRDKARLRAFVDATDWTSAPEEGA